MIHKYIQNLITTLPLNNTNNTNNTIDIVMEGGLFNGSYLYGCISYLKELEKQQKIIINRISGTSIGAFASLFFFFDFTEDLLVDIYKIMYSQIKNNYDINILHKIFNKVKYLLPKNILELINTRIFISYYDIKSYKHIVRNTFNNIEDIFECIEKSCFIPYVINNSIFYKNIYMDGLYPYIFDKCKNTKILYMNIHRFDKITNMFIIKNEITNLHRIYEGIIDIHCFYLTNQKTNICSYINDWSLIDILENYIFIFILKIVAYIIHKIYVINYIFKKNKKKDKYILKTIYKYILKTYCI